MAIIAHLSSAHPRDDSRIFGKQCRTLAAHGHRVTLLVADNLGEDERDGVRIIDVGAAGGRLRRMTVTTHRLLARAIGLDCDIVQLHDPELLPAGLVLKRRGRCVVFDAHEDLPQQLLHKPYLSAAARRLLSGAADRYLRYACRRLDGVITATPHIRDLIMPFQPLTQDINNYPLMSEFPPATAALWRDKDCAVCYVGGLSALRGTDVLTAAAALLRSPARIVLGGRFAEADFAARVRGLPGWHRVDALGQLDRVAVAALLTRSMAGLVTLAPTANHLDAQPVKLFEYMAAGIPVIASDFPRWRAIVDGHRCGLCVDPRDPAAIAAAIDALVGDPLRARELGRNGRSAVERHYNWGSESAKLLAFYAQLPVHRDGRPQ